MSTKSITRLLAIVVAMFAVFGSARGALSATQILDNVVRTLEDTPSLKFNIIMTVGSDTQNAALTIAREKFTYTASPFTVYYDGKTQWTVDTSSFEVSVTEPTADELAETNPLAFVRAYKTSYTISTLNAPVGSYKVKMVARQKSAYIRSAEVTIDANTWMPTTVTALLATGQTMTIRIASATKGSAMPVATFRFDARKHPDYEVIDLR